MPTRPTKLQRWLDVIAYLAGRRFPVSKEQLWGAVPAYAAGLEGTEKEKQTVRRMFERDKDELKRLGIPVETVSFSINAGREEASGYRLAAKDFHLPYLKLVAEARGPDTRSGTAASEFALEPDEAGAALDGLSELAAVPAFPLRTAARSAFRKLAFDLEPDALLREAPVLYAEDPETAASRDTLRQLSDAVQRREAVRFRYRTMSRDRDEDRHVHPYGLLFQHGRWYLVARDVNRSAERMFRVGRMQEVRLDAPKGAVPEYDVPDDFNLASYSGRAAWELGDEDPDGATEADVWFAFPRSLWAERNGHGALVGEGEDGSHIRRFRVLRRDPFLRWVLSLAGDARVTGPPALRDAFTALASEILRRHGGVTS